MKRVWFLSRFGLKRGIDFDHFDLKYLGYVLCTLVRIPEKTIEEAIFIFVINIIHVSRSKCDLINIWDLKPFWDVLSKPKQFSCRVWSKIECRCCLVWVWIGEAKKITFFWLKWPHPHDNFDKYPFPPPSRCMGDLERGRLVYNTRQEIIYRISNLRRNIPD